MNDITAVFTRDKNMPYFRECLGHWDIARRRKLEVFPSYDSHLLILDFGEEASKEIEGLTRHYLTLTGYGEYAHFPKRGFCGNMNTALQFVQAIALYRYDYMVSINDDAMISKNFLINGIKALEATPSIGFIGGVPNIGTWLMPLERIKIPKENNLLAKIDPLDRLHWEASAGIYRVEALRKTGKWDEFFDKNGGVCSDNDYFLRMQKAGYDLYRSGRMPFFHCKGITQSEFRTPLPGKPDPLKQINKEYFFRKWNVMLESDLESTPYDMPFNGRTEQ